MSIFFEFVIFWFCRLDDDESAKQITLTWQSLDLATRPDALEGTPDRPLLHGEFAGGK
jgi:hypothetical protein